MDSKQSTLNWAANSTKPIVPADGYPLKKYPLKRWIYDNHFSQPFVARVMKIPPDEFKRKLREKEKFNREEITALVKLMGAEDAFNAIYFPTKKIRRRVWYEVFDRYRNKEELNE